MARRKVEASDEAARRRAILSMAAKIFAEKGYHAAGIADIAAALKMGHSTFYRYFGNKLDLFAAVLDEILARVSAVTGSEDPSAAATLEEYRAQVERIGRKLFAVFRDDEHLANLLLLEAPGVDAQNRERFRMLIAMLAQTTELYLENGVRRGFLRADLDIPRVARAMNGVAMEALRFIAVSEDREAETERWIVAYVQLIFSGISAEHSR